MRWGTICVLFLFLVIWSIATLTLDCAVATGLSVDGSGEAVLFVLFSIPFNAVVLLLWSVVIMRLVVPETARRIFGNGIRVLDRGQELRFRLPRITPIWAALTAAFAGTGVLAVTLGTISLLRPSLPLAVGFLVLDLVGIVAVYISVAVGIARGRFDLVVDRSERSLTLPQTFGRSQALTISWDQLVGIAVHEQQKKDDDSVTWVYVISLQSRLATSEIKQENLAISSDKDVAEELATRIRTVLPTLSLPPPPLSASTETFLIPRG